MDHHRGRQVRYDAPAAGGVLSMGSNQNPGKSTTHGASLRDLCAMLCLLPKTADPRIDFAEADSELLLALASQLDLTLDCLHQGIAGLARFSPVSHWMM